MNNIIECRAPQIKILTSINTRDNAVKQMIRHENNDLVHHRGTVSKSQKCCFEYFIKNYCLDKDQRSKDSRRNG